MMASTLHRIAARWRVFSAWGQLVLAEIHLQAIIDLIGRDIGRPMTHEQRHQLLLRMCFAEHAVQVRRAAYMEALVSAQPHDAAACIRRLGNAA